MKNLYFPKTMLLAFVGILGLFACKAKKLATSGEKPVKGEVEVAIPCAGFVSDKNFYRATQSASSQDMAMSRDKALLNAKTRLAGLIQARLKNVFVAYRNDRGLGENKEYEEKYEQEARDIANQVLSDVNVACEKVTKSPDGRFNTYVAIEMKKENLYNVAKNSLGKDARLRIDYDEKKFREVFDKEMQQMSDQNP